MILGRVEFWNTTKGFGFAKRKDNEEPVFIHKSKISGEAKILFVDEEVELEIVSTPQGLSAESVVRQCVRHTGEILEFDNQKGLGKVLSDLDKKEYSIHFSNFTNPWREKVAEKKRIKADVGELIEFAVEGAIAVDIVKTDLRKYPLEKFAYLGNFENHLNQLAVLAKDENWNYLNSVPERTLPVLFSYVHYTFSRLLDENKICFKSDKGRDYACFNTGLATKFQEEIFAYFEKNLFKKTQRDPDWYLKGFNKPSDMQLTVFKEKPEIADYFNELNSLSELIYDSTLEHHLDYDHILLDRETRFPDKLKELDKNLLVPIINQALELARKRVRRNYKTAVPHFYNGKIQLLLPLCMQSPDKADLALVVDRVNEVYVSSTVLTLEMAYNNARLLSRPDREWLDP